MSDPTSKTTADPKTTTDRIRDFVRKDMEDVLRVHEQKVDSYAAMLERFEAIIIDPYLARTAFDYVVLGHLSHHNFLRSRIGMKLNG